MNGGRERGKAPVALDAEPAASATPPAGLPSDWPAFFRTQSAAKNRDRRSCRNEPRIGLWSENKGL